jgi:hypothetical protein
MVPKLHLPTLAFDSNSRKGRPGLDTKTVAEEESQYIGPGKQE